jgi:hypothetical protein
VFSQKSVALSEELKEISGIQYINDTLLVAHNDGGNGPLLYFLNPNTGIILKRVFVKDVKNTDWEDIALDGKYLFIGNFGNNNNSPSFPVQRNEFTSFYAKNPNFHFFNFYLHFSEKLESDMNSIIS